MANIALGMTLSPGSDWMQIRYGYSGEYQSAGIRQRFTVTGSGTYVLKYIDISSANDTEQLWRFNSYLKWGIYTASGNTKIVGDFNGDPSVASGSAFGNGAYCTRITVPDSGVTLDKGTVYYIYIYSTSSLSMSGSRSMYNGQNRHWPVHSSIPQAQK